MASKRKYILIVGLVLVAVIVSAIIYSNLPIAKSQKYYEVKKGKFEKTNPLQRIWEASLWSSGTRGAA